jgi:hypothetical protein
MVQALWGVVIPMHAVCPDHVAPMTTFADAYFRRNYFHPQGQLSRCSRSGTAAVQHGPNWVTTLAEMQLDIRASQGNPGWIP